MGCNLKDLYIVKVTWDADARVYWATSDDIPGLVAEAESFEALVEIVLDLAPELLELNCGIPSGTDLPLHIMAERLERVRIDP